MADVIVRVIANRAVVQVAGVPSDLLAQVTTAAVQTVEARDEAVAAAAGGPNVKLVVSQVVADDATIPVGTDIVKVGGSVSLGDRGAGREFIYDPAVNAAFVAANPLISFVDTGGRGFREIRNGVKIKPVLLVISGQSNALGANGGGPNPASPGVKAWNGLTGAWGGSDYTAAPWTQASPGGSSGNNNYALAAAHRIYEETGRPVFIVMDATGGTSIDAWVAAGTASVRYAALKAKVEAALATAELAELTTIDAMIWAQGEEDFTDSFATHLANFATLDAQLRAEAWMSASTPLYVMGLSGLHNRYAPDKALRHYCAKVNQNCVFISMKGLKTRFDESGSGDYTHFLGDALWLGGYERIAAAYLEGQRTKEIAVLPFWGRGDGELTLADTTAIASFTHLVSWDSRDTSSTAVNSHAATGSIAWGEQCVADGNYTFAFGYTCTTANLTNYTLVGGREVTANDAGDYSAAWGFQLSLGNTYQAAFGRGHTLTASGEFAAGRFSKYVDGSRLFQYGIGTSTSARKNAFGIAAAGNVEVYAPSNGTDPGQNEEVTWRRVNDTTLKVLMRGADGVVRSVNLTLA